MYISGMLGTLVRVQEDENARFRFEIWFDYTRQAINLVREGAMLAVANFASSQREQRLSILEVVTILPMHYGLGDDTRGYPGFVVEAARSAANDWEAQETEATEDTTKIKCVAIPTNLEMVQTERSTEDQPTLQEESNLPMLGSPVRLLSTASTQFISNYGIGKNETVVSIGALIRDPKVQIYLRLEELLRTHFGVFGFTGAGKSNLVSTLVSRVLSARNNDNVKIVFFDLMGEYTALLLDHLLAKNMDALVVTLGEKTLPRPVFDYINREDTTDETQLPGAAQSLLRFTLLPKPLKDCQDAMKDALAYLLRQKRLRVFDAMENLTLYNVFFDGDNPRCPAKRKQRQTAKFNQRNELLKTFVRNHGGVKAPLTPENATAIHTDLKKEVEKDGSLCEFADDVAGVFELLEEAQQMKKLNCAIRLQELIDLCNAKSRPCLLLFQSHDPNQLRLFAKQFGESVYESRRQTGEIDPLVSFIFDEADEYIPQQASGSYEQSKDIAMTLARRGRKFGLGIGIATQRVRYLDTSIMAQPHTYFVSKMPRLTDRQVVSEAFGVSEDLFHQTFKFKKGHWLLMSYDATGLEAIPIPIYTENANDRIRKFLDEILQRKQKRAEAQRAGGGSRA